MRVSTNILPTEINKLTRLLGGSACLKMERSDLMMVGVFVGFSEILLGFLVEGLLATERAEIIGLAFIFRCASGCGGVDVHSADGIVYCCCHRFYLLLLDYHINRHLQLEPYYPIADRHFCLSSVTSFVACDSQSNDFAGLDLSFENIRHAANNSHLHFVS